MVGLIDFCLTALVVLLLIPIGVFCLQNLAALWPWNGRSRWNGRSSAHSRADAADRRADAAPRSVVLIPAHDEESVIARTLQSVLPDLGERDRVVVVADNCSDRTADIARELGAVVLERNDPTRRGKGFALDHGVRFLREDPPDVVMVIDADCCIDDGFIKRIADKTHCTGQPVQALNQCDSWTATSPDQVISVLADRFGGLIRPLGLTNLGIPCQLKGTGMSFPWQVLRDAPLANGHLVEDKQLSIDLAVAGYRPSFCSDVAVTWALPPEQTAFITQRTRWEHGHLETAVTQIPRLLRLAIRDRRLDLFCLALDLSIPPLSLLLTSWCALTLCAVSAFCLGASSWPTVLLGGGGMAMTVSMVACWARFCRHEVGLTAIAAVPGYVLRKLPIYLRFFTRPQQGWVRTPREAATKSETAAGAKL
jgi:cellulose synthase/poly-beta-1,6-N-acetylglucosamine synthase-like glycosyltransferase